MDAKLNNMDQKQASINNTSNIMNIINSSNPNLLEIQNLKSQVSAFQRELEKY